MATNIQINYLKDNGEYEILWPEVGENISNVIAYSTSIIGTGATIVKINLPSEKFENGNCALVGYQDTLHYLLFCYLHKSTILQTNDFICTYSTTGYIASNCNIQNKSLTFSGLHSYMCYVDKTYYIDVVSFL